MGCPLCGYGLSPDQLDCPRCENYFKRGIDAPALQAAKYHEIELAKIEAHVKEMGHKSRVKRTRIICGSSLGAVTVICALLAYEHTASVVHIIEAVAGALAALTAAMITMYRIYSANVEKSYRRNITLEKELDRRRTSSLPEPDSSPVKQE